jgi:hypothetical protein
MPAEPGDLQFALQVNEYGRIEDHLFSPLPLRGSPGCTFPPFYFVQGLGREEHLGALFRQLSKIFEKLSGRRSRIIPASPPHDAGKGLFRSSLRPTQLLIGIEFQANRFGCHA